MMSLGNDGGMMNWMRWFLRFYGFFRDFDFRSLYSADLKIIGYVESIER